MLSNFGNIGLKKNSSDNQIGLGLRPRPIMAVLGIFYPIISKLDSMYPHYIYKSVAGNNPRYNLYNLFNLSRETPSPRTLHDNNARG